MVFWTFWNCCILGVLIRRSPIWDDNSIITPTKYLFCFCLQLYSCFNKNLSFLTTYYWLNILSIWQNPFQFTFLIRWTIVENFSWTLRSLSWDCTSEFCSLQMIRYLNILCSTASYLHVQSGRNFISFLLSWYYDGHLLKTDLKSQSLHVIF